jgi:putative sterol carrier protein
MSSQEKADKLIDIFKEKINAKPEGSKNWGGTILINFQDADDSYLLKFAMDGKIEKVEKGGFKILQKKGPKATVLTNTDTIESVFDGTIKGMSAMMGGAIKVEGALEAAMKLGAALL